MDRESPREIKSGISSMPVGETVSLAALGKWILSIILIPWLAFLTLVQRKTSEDIKENHYTKAEVKEKIEDKLEPMKRDISWIRKHLENK